MSSLNENADNAPGLVVSYFGSTVLIEAQNGECYTCHLRRNQTLPVVGDQVEWRLEKDQTGIITSILPRRSTLARGDHRGQAKPIAANIDDLIIVMAPPPVFSDYLIDRYLVAASLLSLNAIIVLNKVDLLQDHEKEIMQQTLAPYQALNYPVIFSSIFYPTGLQQLTEILANKTAVLVGPSGVGKSSLIAALASDGSIRVGEVSAKGTGKHTTTATKLYHLPNHGQLIDSPGVREFNLWPITKAEVCAGFKEFQQISGCKFRDCQHLAEPQCMAQTLLQSGKISASRYKNYRTFMQDTIK